MPASASDSTAPIADTGTIFGVSKPVRQLHSGEQLDHQHGAAHADGAAEQRQKRALKEKLEEDVAIGRAQGLAQSNLARTLASPPPA